MLTSSYFVSEAVVRNLKQRAQRKVTGVSSSHLTEAVAAGLGFNTNAALKAALAGQATVQAQKPSNAKLIARLRELGYAAPGNLQVLPELKHSYALGRRHPLRKRRGVRWTAWRNLMVTAVNAGLEQRLFGLSPGEDWWPGAAPKNNGGDRGLYRFTFDDDLQANTKRQRSGHSEPNKLDGSAN